MKNCIKGEIAYAIAWAPIRVVEIVTGFILLRALVASGLRILLAFRRTAEARVIDSCFELKCRHSILGKVFKRTETRTPVTQVRAVRLENRNRYVHIAVGAGFLGIGIWIGMQWFVDGLNAGYTYLCLVGAAVILAGVLLDLGLYLLIPAGKGRSILFVNLGLWTVRIAGVNEEDARALRDVIAGEWKRKDRAV